jgi:hypothetical protein
MDHELGQDAAKMTLVDRNQKVQAFAPDGSDQTFAECIRRGRSHRRLQGADSEAFQTGRTSAARGE